MENLLLVLKSVLETWLSPSSTSWAIGTLVALLGGTGLLLALFPPSLQSDRSFRPACTPVNIGKRQVEPRGSSSRTRKKSGEASEAYREHPKGAEDVRGLFCLLPSSPQGRLFPEGGIPGLSGHDPPAEADRTASAGAQQPCGEPAEEDAIATSPAVSPAPASERPPPRPLCTFPPSAACPSGAHSRAKLPKLSGEPLRPPRGETQKSWVTQESVPTLASPLPAPRPAGEGIQKAPGRPLPGDGRGPSEAPLTAQGGRPPSQAFGLRRWRSGTVLGAKQGRPAWALGRKEPREESGGGASQDPCPGLESLEVYSASRCAKAPEAWEVVEAVGEGVPGPSLLAAIQARVSHPESPGSGEGPSPPPKSVASDQKELCLKAELPGRAELQGKVWPGDWPPGCAAALLLQHPGARTLRAPDGSAPHCSPARSQREHSGGDTPACQTPSALRSSGRGRSGQERQQPRIRKGPAPWKRQWNILPPIAERDESPSPGAGQGDEASAGPGAPQARGMSTPPQVGGLGDTLGSRSLQLPQEQEQGFAARRFRPRLSHLLPCLKAPKEDRAPAEPLAKGKPGSAAAQSRGPGKSSSVLDGGAVEAPSMGPPLGRARREKLGLCRRLRASICRRLRASTSSSAGQKFGPG